MDWRGRGGSGDSPVYDNLREAEDVAAVVEAWGEPVFGLAHSHGAVCGLEGAPLTDLVRRLILYKPPIPAGLAFHPPCTPDPFQILVEKARRTRDGCASSSAG